MYMLYLVSAIALSAGIGAFAQYNTISKQNDISDDLRVETVTLQQDIISKSLRRQFLIDPTQFPEVEEGSYAELDDDLIEVSISVDGLMNLGESSFYLSYDGDVMAVIETGATAPSTGNGDIELGVSGLPQYAEDLLEYLFGSDYERGPLEDTTDEDDNTDYDITLQASVNLSNDAFELAEASLPQVMIIGHLDMDALEYNEVIQSLSMQEQDNSYSAGYENEDFLAIQAGLPTYSVR
jgi:hypothetical protein